MGLGFYAKDIVSILIYFVVVLVLFRLRKMVARRVWAQRRERQSLVLAAESGS